MFCLVSRKPSKIVSEYDQEIPQSQTADNPEAPRGIAAKPPRDTMKAGIVFTMYHIFRFLFCIQ